jgi:hypothetical protein
MASRREFLQAGIAAAVLPIAAWARVSAPDTTGNPSSFYKVIVDERFPASVEFGMEMSRLGAPIHTIQGDITDLWFHDLDARWKQSPVAIAGLTAHGPLFCLERLAWDHGMRVVLRTVLRTEHASLDDNGEPLISWVISPKEIAPKGNH